MRSGSKGSRTRCRSPFRIGPFRIPPGWALAVPNPDGTDARVCRSAQDWAGFDWWTDRSLVAPAMLVRPGEDPPGELADFSDWSRPVLWVSPRDDQPSLVKRWTRSVDGSASMVLDLRWLALFGTHPELLEWLDPIRFARWSAASTSGALPEHQTFRHLPARLSAELAALRVEGPSGERFESWRATLNAMLWGFAAEPPTASGRMVQILAGRVRLTPPDEGPTTAFLPGPFGAGTAVLLDRVSAPEAAVAPTTYPANLWGSEKLGTKGWRLTVRDSRLGGLGWFSDETVNNRLEVQGSRLDELVVIGRNGYPTPLRWSLDDRSSVRTLVLRDLEVSPTNLPAGFTNAELVVSDGLTATGFESGPRELVICGPTRFEDCDFRGSWITAGPSASSRRECLWPLEHEALRDGLRRRWVEVSPSPAWSWRLQLPGCELEDVAFSPGPKPDRSRTWSPPPFEGDGTRQDWWEAINRLQGSVWLDTPRVGLLAPQENEPGTGSCRNVRISGQVVSWAFLLDVPEGELVLDRCLVIPLGPPARRRPRRVSVRFELCEFHGPPPVTDPDTFTELEFVACRLPAVNWFSRLRAGRIRLVDMVVPEAALDGADQSGITMVRTVITEPWDTAKVLSV